MPTPYRVGFFLPAPLYRRNTSWGTHSLMGVLPRSEVPASHPPEGCRAHRDHNNSILRIRPQR